MSRVGNIGGRLYRGDVSINFVKRQRTWYVISGVILLISIVALLTKGLNLSVEFKGGAVFDVKGAVTATSGDLSRAISAAGGGDSTVQHLGVGWQAQTKALSTGELSRVQDALASTLHVRPSQISTQAVGPTWGSEISSKALQALIVFMIVIVLYLTIAFEWKMAVAAFIALLHDIVITVGVYSLTGFEVAPASVIGLLTILGYSLYDTVVVFDKVRENTAGLLTTSKSTYSDAANLALNQTLVRSINTSLIALLPVASILFVGAGLLGAGTLKDLSLVLFVGMLSGTYSSIFIATPVLADLKERESQYKALAKRVAVRTSGVRAARRAAAKVKSGGGTTIVAENPAVVTDNGDGEGDGADDVAQPADSELATATPQPKVTAAASSRGVRDGTRSGSRQQPRRGGSAQRRPGPKKKRR